MLGEITHLQGIIDDLVVLTAEPHKLPPASEQVQPPLDGKGGDGLPLVGDSRGEKGTAFWGDSWGQRTRHVLILPVGHPGAPFQVRKGVPRTQAGPQTGGTWAEVLGAWGLALSRPAQARQTGDACPPGPAIALPGIRVGPARQPCGFALARHLPCAQHSTERFPRVVSLNHPNGPPRQE